jgi:hypothetical protein
VSYLVDTNVISEVRRRGRSPHVAAWVSSVPEDALYISVLTIGEIRKGIESLRHRDSPRALSIESWLATVEVNFADRTLLIDKDVAHEWGLLNATRPLPAVDSLLAATARVRGLTLVTRNTRDFEGLGVRLLNPFEPRPSNGRRSAR